MRFRIGRRALLKGGLAIGAGLLAPTIARAQSGPIRIGALLPLSGPQAQAGEAALIGIKIAVDTCNKAGGIGGRNVEVVVRDDKGTGVGAVAGLRELESSGVNLMVGGLQSPMALALTPLLAEAKSVCLGSATALTLTHENYSPHFFRLHPHAGMIYRGLGRALGEKFPTVGKWASIVFDSQAGRDAAVSFEAGVRSTSKAQVSFAAPVMVSPSATDFKLEISQFMNADIDGLYLGILVGPAIAFLQQARSVGLTKKLKVIGEGGTDLVIARAMKQNTPDNVWSPGAWYPQAEPSASNKFARDVYDRYVAMTNDRYPVGLTASMGHRQATGLVEGIRKAGSTETAQVIAALEGLTFETVTGPYTLRKEDHQGHGTAVVGNLAPAAAEPFYQVREVIAYDEATVMEPPAPGKPYTF